MTIGYTYCEIHEEREGYEDEPFMICPCCNHVFLTAAEVVDTYNQLEADTSRAYDFPPRFVEPAGVDLIDECPLCNEGW